MGTGDLVKIKPGKSLLFLSLGAVIHSENFSGCFYVDDTHLFFSSLPVDSKAEVLITNHSYK